MLKWMDIIELMGYLTAILSVSVSYVSKIQEQHYSDFLRQNDLLRQSLFSPLLSRLVISLLIISIIYLMTHLVVGKEQRFRDKYFNSFYLFFLGVLAITLLGHLNKVVFVGLPMLILGILMVFFVELVKLHEEE
jgi:hypothetical protein